MPSSSSSSSSSNSSSSSSSSENLSADLCVVPLTEELTTAIERRVIEYMAGECLRTVCVAFKDITATRKEINEDQEDSASPFSRLETKLTCLAIFGIRSGIRVQGLGFRV